MSLQLLDSASLLNGVLGNAIFALCCWSGRKISRGLERHSHLYRQLLLTALATLWVLLNIYLYSHVRGKTFLLYSTISFVLVSYFTWRELNQFWQLGIIGADREISRGIDYKRSLKLCSNSMDFLGVGAAKLTREVKEFEAAMERCHRSNCPIRFLLCSPNNPELEQIARQAGRDRDEYRTNVRESLRAIARQRLQRGRNIEVRFYGRLPIFRLMFIDGWLCLASHYVFGEGDGSQWPQLHVRRGIHHQRDVRSLYYPFQRYFAELWDESQEWDFASNLD